MACSRDMRGVCHGRSYTALLLNGKWGIPDGVRLADRPSGGGFFGEMKLMEWVWLLARASMDRVLILGASGGIGSALADVFETRGADVDRLSRSVNGFDVTDTSSVARHLADRGPYDRVVVATGALKIDGAGPEKTIKGLDPAAMLEQFALNAVGPALVLSHAHTLLDRDAPGVFAVLSARVGSIGDNRIGGWVSYRSAKAAVNQIVRTASIELARTHKQAAVVALHPGTVATAFTEAYLGRHPSVQPATAATELIAVMDGLGREQTGRFFDYSGVEVPW